MGASDSVSGEDSDRQEEQEEDEVLFKRSPIAFDDQEFEREYNSMMKENLEARKIEARTKRTEVIIPFHVIQKAVCSSPSPQETDKTSNVQSSSKC